MAATGKLVLGQLEVVGRLLASMGTSSELERAGEDQSKVICATLARVKRLSPDGRLDITLAIDAIQWGGPAKNRCLASVAGKCIAVVRKRPMQD